MAYFEFLWNEENIEHLAQHGISPEEFEYVFRNPSSKGYSRTTDLPALWGYTEDDRYIMVVFEELDDVTILPVTAYEVPEPS